MGIFCLHENFFACRQTFVGELHKKGSFGSLHGRSTQGKQADGERKQPGCWSLFEMQFLYETVRARKSGRWKLVVAIHGGRLSQVLL